MRKKEGRNRLGWSNVPCKKYMRDNQTSESSDMFHAKYMHDNQTSKSND
jgi:hypothetical protein